MRLLFLFLLLFVGRVTDGVTVVHDDDQSELWYFMGHRIFGRAPQLTRLQPLGHNAQTVA